MSVSDQSVRIRTFKNTCKKDEDENRRRRNGVNVELRKARKDDQLMKRRQVQNEVAELDISGGPLPPVTFNPSEILSRLQSQDRESQFAAVQSVRRILSKERQPPIEMVINAGIVPHLMKYLQLAQDPKIQFEAAWALTNIASGTSEQTRMIVEAGAVPLFIQLLSSPLPNICEQAVWALGNICGDGPECRNMTIKYGIIPPLLTLAAQKTNITFVRNITWVLSNLCRNKNPATPIDAVKQLLPVLIELVYHEDKEVVTDACWGLSYITDGTEDRIGLVISYKEKLFSRLDTLLKCSVVSVVTPALRTVGNIVTGDDEQTQRVIDSGLLKNFIALMQHPKMSIQKEAAWTISNITAGLVSQIQAVIDEGIIPLIVKILSAGDFKAQKEAVWAVTNLTAGGTIEQISLLVFCGVIPPLCDLLTSKDADVIIVILEAIANILKAADSVNQTLDICRLIEEAEGLDKIEQLQKHASENVYQMALNIIDKYFSDENNEDHNIAPQVAEQGNVYEFSANPNVPSGGFSF